MPCAWSRRYSGCERALYVCMYVTWHMCALNEIVSDGGDCTVLFEVHGK